ncbi:MAG: hypothetical protein KAV87_57855, partial [Desulfobacteraceae bacterium]|nr:hypothetical protein [Desulfobacteraceae bacterium]
KKFSTIFSDNDIKTFDDAIVCEEFWNINNGRTLCVGCHRLKKEFIETRKETEKKAGTTIPIHPE